MTIKDVLDKAVELLHSVEKLGDELIEQKKKLASEKEELATRSRGLDEKISAKKILDEVKAGREQNAKEREAIIEREIALENAKRDFLKQTEDLRASQENLAAERKELKASKEALEAEKATYQEDIKAKLIAHFGKK